MIFFTTTMRDDIPEEEIEDADASIDDSILDEITDDNDDDDSDDTEGFGLIDEEDDKKKKKVIDDPEDEEEGDGELEEDAEDVDFDTFDDVDEL